MAIHQIGIFWRVGTEALELLNLCQQNNQQAYYVPFTISAYYGHMGLRQAGQTLRRQNITEPTASMWQYKNQQAYYATYNITACGHMAAASVAKCLAANYHQTSHLLLFKY